ncbi:MAG: sulfotransferase [Gammaproteobacteria bacterium]|nr:sulfotransferase [Gammaproteobacteria bacterium]MCK5092560.1 sulfotransferase [Gammaproteobacteria bacterium]
MKKTVLFIVGSGHSGSTIMDLVLGANSKCFSLGEITKIDRAIQNNIFCVCGSRILECDFWRSVAEDYTAEIGNNPFRREGEFGISLTNNTGIKFIRRLKKVLEVIGLKKNKESWIERTLSLYRAVFRHSGADILVDSSKNIKRAMILANQFEDIDFRIIHLVRDVRGVAYSYQKPTYTVQLPNETEPTTYPAIDLFPIEKTAGIWLRENALISLLLKARLPAENWKRVRYESVCNNPEESLSDICSWLGIAYEPVMIKFGSVPHHNVGGNSSRFNSKEIHNIRSGWKKSLTRTQQERCTRYSSALMRLYGYDVSPSLDVI